jgi:hypothetical protein
MRRPHRLWIWPVLLLASQAALQSVQGRCEGDSCPDESKDARAAGLLGEGIVQQCSKTKDYPADGTKLKPVRLCRPPVDCRGVKILRLNVAINVYITQGLLALHILRPLRSSWF